MQSSGPLRHTKEDNILFPAIRGIPGVSGVSGIPGMDRRQRLMVAVALAVSTLRTNNTRIPSCDSGGEHITKHQLIAAAMARRVIDASPNVSPTDLPSGDLLIDYFLCCESALCVTSSMEAFDKYLGCCAERTVHDTEAHLQRRIVQICVNNNEARFTALLNLLASMCGLLDFNISSTSKCSQTALKSINESIILFLTSGLSAPCGGGFIRDRVCPLCALLRTGIISLLTKSAAAANGVHETSTHEWCMQLVGKLHTKYHAICVTHKRIAAKAIDKTIAHPTVYKIYLLIVEDMFA
jgi:hypothetical protein